MKYGFTVYVNGVDGNLIDALKARFAGGALGLGLGLIDGEIDAEGLSDSEGLVLALGDKDSLSETDGDKDSETLALSDILGLMLAEGLNDADSLKLGDRLDDPNNLITISSTLAISFYF